jgi:hypothetical protein
MVVNENGRRKRIFHIVRTHKRTLSDGSERFVKSHFRGMRKFKWNGYDVVVSVPGKHHGELIDFPVGDTVVRKSDDMDGYISLDEGVRQLHEHLVA